MPARAYSPLLVYTGEAASFNVRGSTCRIKLVPGGRVFERLFPRFLVQHGCNHSLFSTGCGLLESAWAFSATVLSYVFGYPHTLTIQSLARIAGGAVPSAAQWFAGGRIEIGTGAATQRFPILQSGAVSGGVLTITLPRNPSPVPSPGAAVKLYPGCDGGFSTCTAKFSNTVNFGGHPWMPVSNPSLVKLSSAAAGGKK